MKPFVLFFGEATQHPDPSRHVIGEFDSVPEAQFAAESLERHDSGDWAHIRLADAMAIVRAGNHRGAAGHYWWEWREENSAT